MKKTALNLIGSLVLVFMLYSCNTDKDKVILENFAKEIVDDANSIQDVINKNVATTPNGKKTAEYVLNFIREKHKKKESDIIVYSEGEYKKDKSDSEIKINDGDKLYYVKFNDEMTLPFIVNKDSKIVVLLVLTKGGVTISNSRSDE